MYRYGRFVNEMDRQSKRMYIKDDHDDDDDEDLYIIIKKNYV